MDRKERSRTKEKRVRFTEDDDEEIPIVESDDEPKTKKKSMESTKTTDTKKKESEPKPKPQKDKRLKSPVKSSKPKPEKKKEKKADRTWNDLAGENPDDIDSGPFTDEELLTLQESIIEYCLMNNLDEEHLIELLTTASSEKYKKAWVEIASVLPNRKVQSVHAVCKRKFNPNNYRGRWSEEEVDFLLEYVETKGREWETIGKLLGRTALNVRDKFKELGEGNHERRVKQK